MKKKYWEMVLYVVFGALTTLVNILVYAICTRLLLFDVYISNIIAWILALLFAYVTNSKYVFKSSAKRVNARIKEALSFLLSRLFSFGIDMFLMYELVYILGLDDMISKVSVNVIVIVLNYVLSKIFVFKKQMGLE
ncbi:MAG: GtrA family protein [Bacilli bacterium]|jgi:putative flippase GtrA